MLQLPLDIALPPRFGRDAFLAAPSNAAALGAVESWPDWPDGTFLLVGPAGSGKSHLAAVWARQARAGVLVADDLASPDLPAKLGPATLLEDVEAVAAREAPLFHLLNIVREQGAFLLLTARTTPDHWGLRTPDLLSRLRLAPVARLDAPDDALLRAVLVKLFADRQLVVDESVVSYLVLHLDRSLADARLIVDLLDRTGLSLGRRVTRAMAAGLLDTLHARERDD